MNKKQLIEAIADRADAPHGTVEAVIAAFGDVVGEALKSGDAVTLAGFGTFEARSRAARTGRNPQTGEEIQIAASTAPAFKPAAALKRVVNGEG
ncbi:HU family DNA-binding protein [Nocardioides sp. R-C-SC26]|uniref:HU family DNA-binding protein n=1 Tax=Nocardioides sp. R-C-SC26 TaxID=2870414 RepID=UPI0027E1DD57|nr:HU family DNA-binding protein [Nocardioides sp. R-C-SC26]